MDDMKKRVPSNASQILYAYLYISPAKHCLDDMDNRYDREVAAISRRITNAFTASVLAAQMSTH
jgi:hypothetical protein